MTLTHNVKKNPENICKIIQYISVKKLFFAVYIINSVHFLVVCSA